MHHNQFSSLRTRSFLRLLGWISIALVIYVLVIFSLIGDSPWSPRRSSLGFSFGESCRSGTVFVYDLPPEFNQGLVKNCDTLDPWRSWCTPLSNGGFGPKASSDLRGIVPENVIPAWYWTDMYLAEVIYHVRMLNYKCRTLNPENATAFYVPFYVGVDVGRYLWFNHTSKERDRDGELLLNWLKDQPFWKRSKGADHFITLGRLTWDFRRRTTEDYEWGSSFVNMPLMKNVLKISVERSPWDASEFSVPYPTPFHPRSVSDIIEWQRFLRARSRRNLFCFVGATREKIKNDFRALLINYCKTEGEKCALVDCSEKRCYRGSPAFLEAFLDSDFCLQPKGDGVTRRSTFDCLLAGSIPVFFWETSFKGQYEWHLPAKAETYSVFIDSAGVRNGSISIRSTLEKLSKDEIRKLRENVIDLIPRIVYAEPSSGLGTAKDAFDLSVEGVLSRIQVQNFNSQQST